MFSKATRGLTPLLNAQTSTHPGLCHVLAGFSREERKSFCQTTAQKPSLRQRPKNVVSTFMHPSKGSSLSSLTLSTTSVAAPASSKDRASAPSSPAFRAHSRRGPCSQFREEPVSWTSCCRWGGGRGGEADQSSDHACQLESSDKSTSKLSTRSTTSTSRPAPRISYLAYAAPLHNQSCRRWHKTDQTSQGKTRTPRNKKRANHLLRWSGRRWITPADHCSGGAGGMDHLDGASHVPRSLCSPCVRREKASPEVEWRHDKSPVGDVALFVGRAI